MATEASISSIQTPSNGSGATSQQTGRETDASTPTLVPPEHEFMSGQTSAGTKNPPVEEEPFPFTPTRRNYDQKPTIEFDETTGAFKYIFPIITPPGKRGMERDLKLIYDSSLDKNEYLGLNWTKNIPFIERINRTGIENLYSDYYFSSSLDGELRATTTTEGASMSLAPGGEAPLSAAIENAGLPTASSSIQHLLIGRSPSDAASIKSAEIVKLFPTGEYEDSPTVSGSKCRASSRSKAGSRYLPVRGEGAKQLGFGVGRFRRDRTFPHIQSANHGLRWNETGGMERCGGKGPTNGQFRGESPPKRSAKPSPTPFRSSGKRGTAIVPGKRGNTTSTFYPSMDGSAQYSPSPLPGTMPTMPRPEPAPTTIAPTRITSRPAKPRPGISTSPAL